MLRRVAKPADPVRRGESATHLIEPKHVAEREETHADREQRIGKASASEPYERAIEPKYDPASQLFIADRIAIF